MATITWVIDMDNEYQSYVPSEYELSLKKKCIYKWPSDLVMKSSLSKHRTPHMASFGPYHNGKKHLQPMEHHKKRALYRLLRRSEGVSIADLVDSLKGIEQDLRDSYDDLDRKWTSDLFLRMMLLDGCFILELLCSLYENSSDNNKPGRTVPTPLPRRLATAAKRLWTSSALFLGRHSASFLRWLLGRRASTLSIPTSIPTLSIPFQPTSSPPYGSLGLSPYERIFSSEGKLTTTVFLRDMLLLENQIPLLVLKKLVEVGKLCDANSDAYLNRLILGIYRWTQLDAFNLDFPDNYIQSISQMNGSNLHILDIYRKFLINRSTTEQERTPSEEGFIKSVCMRWLHVIGKGIKQMPFAVPILVFRLLGGQISKPGNVRSAMRFREAGVEFKKAEDNSGLRVTFDKERGVLTLPILNIDDNTAAIYMNLMAFERMHKRPSPEFLELASAARRSRDPFFRERGDEVTSYIVFMDSLIDTAEDVSLLCSQGIMRNFLGSDEDAANVFNKLGDGITYTPDEERYKDLQSYVASEWNVERAYLKRNYFQNPWSILSLLAAIAVLVLTFIQTVFSVLAVTKAK